jgi:hypothetical protein
MSQSDSETGIFEYNEGAKSDTNDTNKQLTRERLSLEDDDTVLATATEHQSGDGYASVKVTIRSPVLAETEIEPGDKLLMASAANGGFRAEPIDE